TQAQEADLKKTTNSRVDKYRMLLEAEGLTQRAPAPSPGAEEPHAGLDTRRTTASGLRAAWSATPSRLNAQSFSWCGVAAAQTPPTAAEAAARVVLEEYRRAHEEGNLDHLASLYVAFPASQRQALDAYLKDARGLRVELVDVKIQPRGPDL